MATRKATRPKPRGGKGSRHPGSAGEHTRKTRRADLAAVVARLRAHRPALTDAARGAFRSRSGDARCEELGARTRSRDVLRQAVAWAVELDALLRAFPEELGAYGPTRFTWFLECIEDLLQAIETQDATGTVPGVVHTAFTRAREGALLARRRLLRKLRAIASGNETDVAILCLAEGSTGTDAEVAASLRGLADLADDWLAGSDETSRVLVESAGLTRGDADSAREAANDLVATASVAAFDARDFLRDSPAVNRIEGRVLAEMGVILEVVRDAREENPRLPALVLSRGTRAVLEAARPAPAPAGESPPSGAAARASSVR